MARKPVENGHPSLKGIRIITTAALESMRKYVLWIIRAKYCISCVF